WRRILENVRRMGFRFVDTYVPWNVHETTPGAFDFGQVTPEKDVAAFLQTCREVGLYVLCRPGPHINAELPFFGYPERVVNNPDIQMRTATGAPAVLPVANIPIAAPSYACEQFYDAVAVYFDAVAPVLKPYLYPDGPIVAVQSDNEMSFFFRTRCYDVDYHPEAINLYRQTLRCKYADIGALNACYRTQYESFDAVEPPREYAARERGDLPYYLDWAEAQEEYVRYGLVRIRTMLEERGLTGIPYYHNYPTFYPEFPFRMGELEEHLDIAGVDAYPRPDQYPAVKRGAQFTSTMSRLPFIPEFGSGVWAWYKPQSAQDHLFNSRAAFMHGIRAINYYMLADRDRWLNTPMLNDGTVRESMFNMFQGWNAQLGRLDWHRLRVERPVVIVTPRLYERLRYVAVEGSIPYDWLMNFYVQLPGDFFLSTSTPGTRDAIQQQLQTWIDAFRSILDGAGVSYALADSDITDEKLTAYAVVIAPTFEWLDRDTITRLDRYARSGGHVICGPRIPTETVTGEPLDTWQSCEPVRSVERLDIDDGLWLEDVDLWTQPDSVTEHAPFITTFRRGAGEVVVVSAVFPAVGALSEGVLGYQRLTPMIAPLLAGAGVAPLWSRDNPNIDINLLSGGGRRILCLANPTPDAQTVCVEVEGAKTFINIDTGARSEDSLRLTMLPWTIGIWEVEA
ncbi:MAG: beta-galactosidase, partial [Anaerolineae bacterium]|nr:beta-galactosidase [Anaerolineae bacterium]